MASCAAVMTQAALMESALRLVDERPDLPAGSVLRCFARAVGVARRAGALGDDLPPRAEAVARRLLADRQQPGGGHRKAVWDTPLVRPSLLIQSQARATGR